FRFLSSGRSFETAKSRCATRSPKFEPRATAVLTKLFDPACWKNFAVRRTQDVGTPAEQIRAAGQRLLEEPLLLEHLAEDDLQHFFVAIARHALDARPPAIDERLRVASILVHDRPRRVIRFAPRVAPPLVGVDATPPHPILYPYHPP